MPTLKCLSTLAVNGLLTHDILGNHKSLETRVSLGTRTRIYLHGSYWTGLPLALWQLGILTLHLYDNRRKVYTVTSVHAVHVYEKLDVRRHMSDANLLCTSSDESLREYSDVVNRFVYSIHGFWVYGRSQGPV